VLKDLPDNSVDSIVTDPPYGLNFMGKEWDNPTMLGQGNSIGNFKLKKGDEGYVGGNAAWYGHNDPVKFQLWATEWAVECLRVLKPGGHILAFGGSRTWHRLAVAVEDAGFEIRDNIAWIYGSGFPKSLDVSKAIDKNLGAVREKKKFAARAATSGTMANGADSRPWIEKSRELGFHEAADENPVTSEAKTWEGWGTALKPAHEPVVVGRKPLVGTVAENVLLWGVGGLNIDGSRIGTSDELGRPQGTMPQPMDWGKKSGEKFGTTGAPGGRWPANVIFDEVTAGLLDEQSGVTKSSPHLRVSQKSHSQSMENPLGSHTGVGVSDFGGASRFFYVAKASKRDRNEGLEGLEAVRSAAMNGNLTDGQRKGGDGSDINTPVRQNFHPTVKPTALMRYLIKLVTPPGGTVLDPFTGSGSTGKAALLDGFQFVGIELTEEYLPIIEGRLRWASEQVEDEDGTLF
jgi:site-specific DNA-methyltransferase (adenine-specific)